MWGKKASLLALSAIGLSQTARAQSSDPALVAEQPAHASAPGIAYFKSLKIKIVATPNHGNLIAIHSQIRLRDDVSKLQVTADRGQILDKTWIENQFYVNDLLGKSVEADRIVLLIKLINQVILGEGYINSGVRLDEQFLPQNGEPLELSLVLGRVRSADKDGNPAVVWPRFRKNGLTTAYVADRLPATREVPFNAMTLEHQFRLLADNPAIATVNADLRAGASVGTAEITVSVEPAARCDLYAAMANNRSPSVGGVRYAIGATVRNVGHPGSYISTEIGKTRGLNDGVIAVEFPAVSPKINIVLNGSFNQASVIDRALLPLDIRSQDWSASGGMKYNVFERPLLPGNSVISAKSAIKVTLSALVIHRESRTELLGEPFSFSPGSNDGLAKYTAFRSGIDLIQRSTKHVLAGSIGLTVGIDGSRSSAFGVLTPKRHFIAAAAQVNYARRIDNSGLELRGRMFAQLVNSILYSLERVAAGGQDTVRGLRESALLADQGVIGSIELAKSFSIVSRGPTARKVSEKDLSLSVFLDGAWIGNKGRLQPERRWLSSIGIGASWSPVNGVSAKASYAKTFVTLAQAKASDLQDRGFQFQIVFRPLEFISAHGER